ncbi:hypothetical protein POTOM_016490 [Populus tomentosa]|uniref:Major facilitator superfamily (MFS) profile domain-containing protein n=1 Tax=Populus tomentosa TaxID=118781 RepID=A0A8X8D6X7_POPTO|nr:hypothetical protein POTOM_016490 [Populus tomentosa]
MAVGLAVSSEHGQYNGRVTSFVILSCMVASMGGLLFGYDIGISGGVTSMEPFLKKFFPVVYTRMKDDTKISNYCKFDSQLLTSFTSSLYVAGLVASFFASSITRYFGRKPSILAGGAAFLSGSALNGAATNLYMLIFGRVLLGVGVGFANQAVPLYLSEMAPPRYRGAINNGFQLCIAIGVLSANFINFGTEKIEGGWGWRISLVMAAIPATFLTIGSLFLPETPNSLIQRFNDEQKAKTMLQRIRINVIAFYAPVLLRTIGLSESVSLIMSALIAGVVGTASTLLSMLVVDKLGRRVMLICGGVQMFVSQIMIGSVMAAQLGDHGSINKGYAHFVLTMISIYVSGFAWSWGPLGWLVPSEIFPLEIRSVGQSIVVAVNFVFTFVVAQTFLGMLCHFKSGIFFFFGGWVAVMTAFVYLLLPETKKVPIEVMERVWREHWFWKRFVDEFDDKSNMEPA